MIKVGSTIKLNMPFINKLSDAAVTALEQTAEALRTEVVQAQVMPRDTGALQNEKTFIKAGEKVTSTYKDGSEVVNSISKAENGKVAIVTTSPQVRRLYFHPEYNFKTEENPNAKGLWYEDWQEGGKYEDFCQNAYEKIYRRLTGL